MTDIDREDEGQIALVNACYDDKYSEYEEASANNDVCYIVYLKNAIKVVYPDDSSDIIKYGRKLKQNPKEEKDVAKKYINAAKSRVNNYFGKKVV